MEVADRVGPRPITVYTRRKQEVNTRGGATNEGAIRAPDYRTLNERAK